METELFLQEKKIIDAVILHNNPPDLSVSWPLFPGWTYSLSQEAEDRRQPGQDISPLLGFHKKV